jgi:ribosomal-protein-alanine N-acetyltransferase
MGEITVRQVTKAEQPQVVRLIRQAENVYSGFEINDDIDSTADTFLAALSDEKLRGFVFCPIRSVSRAWLQGLGVSDDWSLDAGLKALLPSAINLLRSRGVTCLIYMGSDEWLIEPLRRDWGFAVHDRVVTFVKQDWRIPARGNADICVRPVQMADILALVAIDQQTFGSLWCHDEETFAHIMDSAPYFVVAILGEKVIGYQFNHRLGEKGHLSRLAVHPAYQGLGIGVRLMAEATDFFRRKRMRTITLNTQKGNLVSQRLYRWFGFRPTGEEMVVLMKRIDG